MNQHMITGGIATVTFVLGVNVGGLLYKKRVIKELEGMQPLIASMITDIIDKSSTENMTKDELRLYTAEQVDFVKIIAKS